MTDPEHAPDLTLDQPREVADFLAALGLCAHELELIAIVTGWQKRSPRKITAAALLASLCAQTLGGTSSFNDIARRWTPLLAGSLPVSRWPGASRSPACA